MAAEGDWLVVGMATSVGHFPRLRRGAAAENAFALTVPSCPRRSGKSRALGTFARRGIGRWEGLVPEVTATRIWVKAGVIDLRGPLVE